MSETPDYNDEVIPDSARSIINEHFGPSDDQNDDEPDIVHRCIKVGPFEHLTYSDKTELGKQLTFNALFLGSSHNLDVSPDKLIAVAESILEVSRQMQELGYRLTDYEMPDAGNYKMSFAKPVDANLLNAEIGRFLETFQVDSIADD